MEAYSVFPNVVLACSCMYVLGSLRGIFTSYLYGSVVSKTLQVYWNR
jgi:hypothetical protein